MEPPLTTEPTSLANDQRPSVLQDTAEEMFARWTRQEEESRITAGKRLAEIFVRVRQERSTWGFLVAGYSGCGDSGSIEYVGFLESRDQAEVAEFWERPAALQTAFPEGVTDEELSDLLDQFLPSGYENNDGGQGVVRVDLATGSIDVAHDWCVSTVESDPRSYSLDVMTGMLSEVETSTDA